MSTKGKWNVPDRVVKTTFSGVLVSLASEGVTDTEGEVRYTRAFKEMVDDVMREMLVRGVPANQRENAVRELASEIEANLGLDPELAMVYAGAKIKPL